jgi:hypothetical protein
VTAHSLWVALGEQVTAITSCGINDLYFVTTVTLENVGDNTLYDVQYLRNIDPDVEQVRWCQTLANAPPTTPIRPSSSYLS